MLGKIKQSIKRGIRNSIEWADETTKSWFDKPQKDESVTEEASELRSKSDALNQIFTSSSTQKKPLHARDKFEYTKNTTIVDGRETEGSTKVIVNGKEITGEAARKIVTETLEQIGESLDATFEDVFDSFEETIGSMEKSFHQMSNSFKNCHKK